MVAVLFRSARRACSVFVAACLDRRTHRHAPSVLSRGNLTGLAHKMTEGRWFGVLTQCTNAAYFAHGLPVAVGVLFCSPSSRIRFVFALQLRQGMVVAHTSGSRARPVPLPATCGIRGQPLYFSLLLFYVFIPTCGVWAADTVTQCILFELCFFLLSVKQVKRLVRWKHDRRCTSPEIERLQGDNRSWKWYVKCRDWDRCGQICCSVKALGSHFCVL